MTNTIESKRGKPGDRPVTLFLTGNGIEADGIDPQGQPAQVMYVSYDSFGQDLMIRTIRHALASRWNVQIQSPTHNN